jgi:uncharacterized membrane protein HdeD (DUF308 family)
VSTTNDSILRDRYWILPLARVLPAAIIALAITFSSNHSAVVGYFALGGFLLVSGAIVFAGALRLLKPGTARTLSLVQGAIMVVGGTVALIFTGPNVALLLFLTSALLGASGVIELIAGLVSRGANPAARDWIFVGALSALFAIVFLFIPSDFYLNVVLEGEQRPALTASVILVGAFGAYAAVVAVYLAIAGLSLKWAKSPEVVVAGEAS